ncbi:aminotransferase class IV [Caloramator sp. E03]|uniref:aminotransferase class IV n=1 Tax=Caloramator sp. E03 TaxID=2576307 RepID=UPI00110FFC26|nr:aminotransferase class IV [Caloramator sp. E03]QCX34551.1 aminotransferase class IV [Caloramator sp. E03]
MSEATFNFFIHNSKIYNVSEFDKIYIEINPSIYEVIRIINKIPIFLEDHYERLKNSAQIIGFNLDEKNISLEHIKENITKMIKLNDIEEYNIKIVLNNLKSSLNEYYFFIKSSYPDEQTYKKGVKTCLFKAVRENPNAKVINAYLRNKINNILSTKNYYEAILVNEDNEITEGSRSNIFFIKNNSLYTAHISKVLPGITRQKILYICNQNNISVYETSIYTDDINSFDAAFISGTSPKVLPIAKIDNFDFNIQNPLLLRIMKLYDDEIKNYILKQKQVQ